MRMYKCWAVPVCEYTSRMTYVQAHAPNATRLFTVSYELASGSVSFARCPLGGPVEHSSNSNSPVRSPGGPRCFVRFCARVRTQINKISPHHSRTHSPPTGTPSRPHTRQHCGVIFITSLVYARARSEIIQWCGECVRASACVGLLPVRLGWGFSVGFRVSECAHATAAIK